MNNKHLSKTLNDLWQLRFNGEVAPCGQQLAAYEQKSGSFDQEAIVNISMLKASFKRFHGQHADALSELSALEISELSTETKFQFYFQLALCHDALSEFSTSMKNYLMANKYCYNRVSELMCKYNLAIARYHLGMGLGHLTSEIKELVLKLSDHPVAMGFKRVELVLLKYSFFNCESMASLNIHAEDSDQTLFFKSWCARLPWMGGKLKESFLTDHFSGSDFFHKDYRLGTLMLDERFDSDCEIHLQSQIERLYLWFWSWMSDPDSRLIHHVCEQLATMPLNQKMNGLAQSDFWLMDSVLGWLALMNDQYKKIYSDWFSLNYTSEHKKSELFKIDSDLRSAIGSRDFKKYQSLLAVEGDGADFFRIFMGELALFGQTDPKKWVIKNGSNQALEQFAFLIKTSAPVHFSEVLSHCFGLDFYDELIHAPKVHNLVGRFKKKANSSVEIKTKDGFVYLNDPDDHIVINKLALLATKVTVPKKAEQIYEPRSAVAGSGYIEALAAFSENDKLSRSQLQDLLGFTKSSTNRWLLGAMESGLISKSGQGRSTYYHLS